MGQNIDRELIDTLVAEAEPFWEAFPHGEMQRDIEEYGFCEENGLRFTWEDVALGQFYVGLAVLARDMHLYLIEHPRDDAAFFHAVVSKTHMAEAATYHEQAFPDYGRYLPQDQVAALPIGLALAAAQGVPTVTALRDPRIVHEWTFKPGKRLQVNFLLDLGLGFRNAVCSQNEQTATSIAMNCLTFGCGSPALFWYPLVTYLGLIFVNGLESLCKPD